MMRRFFVIALLATGLSACFLTILSLAQQEPVSTEPAMAPEEEAEYSYGAVVNVSVTELVVSEYDYEKDEEVNVTYVLDPKIELKNVKAINEIVIGDSVDISYIVKDGKKIATIISVEKEMTSEEPISPDKEPVSAEEKVY